MIAENESSTPEANGKPVAMASARPAEKKAEKGDMVDSSGAVQRNCVHPFALYMPENRVNGSPVRLINESLR